MGGAGNDKQIKARTFEVPGAGGFLLTDSAPGLDAVYRIGEEIDVYDGIDELGRKINHYLLHVDERDKIAQAGYARTAACYTYEDRLAGLLELALKRQGKRSPSLAHSKMPNGDANRETLPDPSLGPSLRLARLLIVQACCLIWGRKRGLKAARRLVFEVSYRVFGIKSFGAMSIPGRMFPYV
jgi:spore maturation protein CgeB